MSCFEVAAALGLIPSKPPDPYKRAPIPSALRSLLCTEGSDATLERLASLSRHAAGGGDGAAERIVSNTYLERVSGDGEELLARLRTLRLLLERLSGTPAPVRLLVVDSVAAPTREAARDDYALRAAQLLEISALLRRYADEFELAVLASNHVMDVVDPGEGPGGALQRAATGGRALVSGGREVTPALGLAWASAVDARRVLAREASASGPVRRTLRIVWSPDLPERACSFSIGASGARGLLGPSTR